MIPGTYFFSIPNQVKCHSPLANIKMIKNAIRSFLKESSFKKNTAIQNPRKRISKIRNDLNEILKKGHFL